jgi:hypothetical protein
MTKEQLPTDDHSYFSYKEHAKRELDILYPTPDETQRTEIERIIKIMEVIDGIDDFESRYARIMPYLFQQKPITPLTGADDEWTPEIEENGNHFAINKRASDVVKHNGKAFWLAGKVFSDDGGKTFHQTENSYVLIESFPFQVPFTPEHVVNPTDDEIVSLEVEIENSNQSI